MSTLWGSGGSNNHNHNQHHNDDRDDEVSPTASGGNNHNHNNNSSSNRRSNDGADTEDTSYHHQPDEHTRLLPNRLNSDRPFLTPDDPAVSPYNLWSVRVARYATVLFTTVTLVWWVLMLVTVFVTPPGIHTRGSPFWSFGYACVALFNVLFTLVFFGVPSRAVRILSAVMGLLLFVNVIITVSVERTRHEEGWVGIVSVVCECTLNFTLLLLFTSLDHIS